MDGWLRALIANLIKALFESTLELVGCLGISISVEDTPGFESRLSEHLGLDLPVQLTSTSLDIERVWCTAAGGAHDQITSIILVTWYLSWALTELQVPLLLLLLALLILSEGSEESFAFLHFPVSVGMDDLGEILHEAEVSTHGISESSELAKLWNQCDFVTSLPIFVDEERLVRIRDVLVVSGLVVLGVAHLLTILIEGGSWAHTEVDTLHAVRLLVVPCDNGRSSESSLDGLLPVSATSLTLGLLT